jgi:ribosome maturation factor RimP
VFAKVNTKLNIDIVSHSNFILHLQRITRKEAGASKPLFYCLQMNKESIITLVKNKLVGTDLFLVDVKYSLQRIAVRIDKPTGVTIGECTALSRYLTEQLEPTDILNTHELEVGSPGMSEPLLVFQQYLRRLNKPVNIIDLQGKQYTGTLVEANPNSFTIQVAHTTKEGKKRVEVLQPLTFNYSDIKEAKLIF